MTDVGDQALRIKQLIEWLKDEPHNLGYWFELEELLYRCGKAQRDFRRNSIDRPWKSTS